MVEKILVVCPHPDDGEFGAAGTIAKWTDEGKEVFYVICTNGDKGSSDPNMTSERLAKIRRQEQQAAADVLGVKEVIFLDYPDGGLEDTPQFRGDIVRLIRYFKPKVLLTSDPYRKYIWHRDHRITGRVALDAVFPYARDRLSYPEHEAAGLSPHKVEEIYCWSSDEPNVCIDISATFERKLKSLQCHISQVGGRGGRLEDRVRDRAAMMGKEKGVPLAEAFYHQVIP
ncbi:MAG: PIG-L family deacetylase [Dehalococcoidia bacterium]|nr:PIG-L family deacetylase [Dehalococcoidia bacterium]